MKAVKFELGNTYKGTGEVAGIDFTLLKRTDDLCIFQRSDDWYEVVTLVHRKYRERTINGKLIISQANESYAQGNGWNGKMTHSIDRANEIFDETLLNKENKKWNFNN